MRLNVLRIVALLAIVMAPIVDAIACDDCKDMIPFREMQLRVATGADYSDNNQLPSDAGSSTAPQENGGGQDFCPVCANMAVGLGTLNCVPYLCSQTNELPQMLALLAPSYPINKPPQK